MEISTQKQTAIDNLVRETAGTKRAVVAMVGCRYSGKHSHYQHYLLSDGHTIYVNLDRDPMTAYLSEEPNKKAMAKQAKREAKAAKRAEKRAAHEQKIADAKKAREEKAKAPRAAKVVKYDPKLSTLEADQKKASK